MRGGWPCLPDLIVRSEADLLAVVLRNCRAYVQVESAVLASLFPLVEIARRGMYLQWSRTSWL
jgi:hypothetical protein